MLSKAELSAALLLVGASVASALPLAAPLDDPNSFDLQRRAEFDAIPTGVSLIDYFPRFTSPTSSSVFQAGGDIEISWWVLRVESSVTDGTSASPTQKGHERSRGSEASQVFARGCQNVQAGCTLSCPP